MRKVVYSFLMIGALSFAGCTLPKMVKTAKEQELTVTPNPLEVHKDTVAFDMAANLPVKMLKKGNCLYSQYLLQIRQWRGCIRTYCFQS
jgi:hypothetical protein